MKTMQKHLRRQASCMAGTFIICLVVPFASQAQTTTINLWPGVAPGSEHWHWQEKIERHVVNAGKDFGTIIEDVVTPTLTAYLPEQSEATGTGVIIAPGGACIALAMKATDELAAWLRQKGVAAFVLKYRLKHKLAEGMPKNLSEDEACQWGIADGIQALKVVRRHAKAWHVSPDRIGFLGFSAGGMIASEVLVQQDPALRPDFAALIYGAPFESMPKVPAHLPPVFMAWAQNDDTAGYAMRRFYTALMAAGDKPEAHVYAAGGHGFATFKTVASSGHWRQEFYWWLQAQTFAASKSK